MWLRWALVSLVAMIVLLGFAFGESAQAQTAPASPTGSTTSAPKGAFESLSPGNQKIARALFEAQTQPGTGGSTSATGGSTTSTPKPLTLDEIAAKKQGGEGWGRVFKDMKAQGLVQQKNLGQVVSGNHRGSHGPAVTAGGRPFAGGGLREGERHHQGTGEGQYERGEHGRQSYARYENNGNGAGRGQTYSGGSGRAEGSPGHAGKGGK